MMAEPLDELYLTWLYKQVASVKLKNPARTYWALLRQLYTKEYVWIIPNDDNRVEDGRDLRQEFLDQEQIHGEPLEWMELGCSMLEMLIGLSRRLSFEADGEVEMWFWELLRNWGVDQCTDKSNFRPEGVDEILERNIWRNYSGDGRGGLFPLREPHKDQRDVEIWYQMASYLLELDD